MQNASKGSALTVAVIGHVNHGKTALVRALTGMETDRLKEEIERGLSITLGFAWKRYDGGTVDLIDAPGHEDFIRAMVAGATGARAALLVVSAVEGFARQTAEHLEIAGLLGITTGVVAVTKSDLITEDQAAEIRAALAARLAGTFLRRAPMVLCSASTGTGLDELDERLAGLCATSPPPTPLAGAFLPIDRAFTVAGSGVVVTGTLQGAALRADEDLVLQPSGRKAGLRQIQVHGEAAEFVEPGGRVAAALRGIRVDEVRAGDVLCARDAYAASTQVDVLIRVSADAPRPVRHLDDVRVMWGARRDVASVRLVGAKAIAPGESDFAQLRFAAPVVAFAGQRAVLRQLSPARTVGGAEVLDPAAMPSRGRHAARRAVLEAARTGDGLAIARVLAGQSGGVIATAEVARLARMSQADVTEHLAAAFEALDSERQALRESVVEVRAAYLETLARAHREAPARAAAAVGAIRAALGAISSREIIGHVERTLAAEAAIRLEGSHVALPDHDPLAALSADALARLAGMEAALRAGGVTPPDIAALTGPDEEGGALLDLLCDLGRVTRLRNVSLRQTLAFHRDALATAIAVLDGAYPDGATFTTGEARAALATSRKFIVPLLEHFDAIGATAREGDVRRVTASPFPSVSQNRVAPGDIPP